MNWEHVPMRGVPFILACDIKPVIEYLDFNGAQERHARGGNGARPNEHSGIPPARSVPPIEFENKILVLARRPQGAGGKSGAMNQSVTNTPGLRSAIHIHPAAEIPSVEKRDKLVVISSEDSRGNRHQEKNNKGFHDSIMATIRSFDQNPISSTLQSWRKAP